MNSRIVLSLVTMVAAAVLVTGATFAFFSDEGTSSGNVLTVGDLDLKLDGGDTSDAKFNVSGLAPGQTVAADIALTHGVDSIDIAKVGFKSELADGSAAAFSTDLLLRVFEGGEETGGDTCTGTDITSDIQSQFVLGTDPLTVDNFDGFFDGLFDGNETTTSSLTFSTVGDNDICLEIELVSDADNTLQGQTADVTFTFSGLQHASQTPE